MLEALVRQNDLEELWGKPDFLESGCTTTKQHQQFIEWNVESQENVRFVADSADTLPGAQFQHECLTARLGKAWGPH